MMTDNMRLSIVTDTFTITQRGCDVPMKIDFLVNHPQFICTVTNWLWSEWGNPNNHLFWSTLVESSMSTQSLPQIYVAINCHGVAVGTASLWRCDLLSRQDLMPWLACLYVAPPYRMKGIGEKLQDFCCCQANSLGFHNIYLFSELKNYYERFSWRLLGNTQHELGFETNLFMKRLRR